MVAYADIASPRPIRVTSAEPPRQPVQDSNGRADAMDIDDDAQAIIREINEGRKAFDYAAMDIDGVDSPALPLPLSAGLQAVIDTNVLLNHGSLLPEVVDFLAHTRYASPPASLLIPRIVIHELDSLKLSSRTTDRGPPPIDPSNSSSSIHSPARPRRGALRVSVGQLARQAGTWLVESMRKYPACVRGQAKVEVSKAARDPNIVRPPGISSRLLLTHA
jgi:hypothetical protein